MTTPNPLQLNPCPLCDGRAILQSEGPRDWCVCCQLCGLQTGVYLSDTYAAHHWSRLTVATPPAGAFAAGFDACKNAVLSGCKLQADCYRTKSKMLADEKNEAGAAGLLIASRAIHDLGSSFEQVLTRPAEGQPAQARGEAAANPLTPTKRTPPGWTVRSEVEGGETWYIFRDPDNQGETINLTDLPAFHLELKAEMRKAGEDYREALGELRERCAKVCDEIAARRKALAASSSNPQAISHYEGQQFGANDCAAAIRSLPLTAPGAASEGKGVKG